MTMFSKKSIQNSSKHKIINTVKNHSYEKEVAFFENDIIKQKMINSMVEKNVYINIIDSITKEDYNYKISSTNKHLQIRVVLEGEFYKINEKTKKKIHYKKNHINIEYTNNEHSFLFNKKGEHIKYFCITLKEAYLEENPYLLDILEKNLKEDFFLELFEPELNSRYDELFNREYLSMLDKIYLRNKSSVEWQLNFRHII